MFIRKSAEVFIYFTSSHVRLLLEVGSFRLILFFERAPRRLLMVIRGGALSIKCSRTLYSTTECRGAYFCPTYIESGVPSSVYSLDSICWFNFYYISGQFVLYLVHYCICG